MKVEADASPRGAVDAACQKYRSVAGHSLATWLLLALISFATQTILYFEMAGRGGVSISAGEFGLLNCALGVIGLLAVPILSLPLAFRWFFARPRDTRLEQLRDSEPVVIETAAWAWGGMCVVLMLLPLPLPALPSFALQLLVLMNVLLALGGIASTSFSVSTAQPGRSAIYVLAGAVARLVLVGIVVAYQPRSEAALLPFLAAGLITLLPAWRSREIDARTRWRACGAVLQRDFLTFAAATLCVLGASYLFTNADRIAAVSWIKPLPPAGQSATVYLGEVGPSEVDAYQAAGMLGRSVLWGTQPLLWILYADRSILAKTTAASLKFFWIYLGAVFGGAVLLILATRSWALGGLLPFAEKYEATFAVVMIPLGLLQGLGVFALASRRYPECCVLGGCGIGYALVLAWFGRRPDVMLPYMLGTALISLMLVLFVGVVRWGRRQP